MTYPSNPYIGQLFTRADGAVFVWQSFGAWKRQATNSAAVVTPKYVTSATTAIAGDEIWVGVSSGTVTISLPVSPNTGDVVIVNRNSTDTVVVARNGNTILSSASDYVISLTNEGARFVFLDGTWKVTKVFVGA